jgi:hypothetical protein
MNTIQIYSGLVRGATLPSADSASQLPPETQIERLRCHLVPRLLLRGGKTFRDWAENLIAAGVSAGMKLEKWNVC